MLVWCIHCWEYIEKVNKTTWCGTSNAINISYFYANIILCKHHQCTHTVYVILCNIQDIIYSWLIFHVNINKKNYSTNFSTFIVQIIYKTFSNTVYRWFLYFFVYLKTFILSTSYNFTNKLFYLVSIKWVISVVNIISITKRW